MYYKIFKKLRNSNFAIVIIFTTIINFIIYGKMLIGSHIYMYVDIGSDTINIYYPSLYYLVNSMKSGNFDLFIPYIALGNSVFSIITQMLDPFFVILLLIPMKYLPLGILITSILKIYIISVFAFLIFKRYFKSRSAQVICPLIYTFSSYIILWGQHQTFLKSMMLFTVFMYLLDKFIFDEKSNKFIFILLISFFSCSSIYFFYATGIFSVIYMTFWVFNNRLTLKSYFLKCCQLLGMAISGMFLSMVLILPWVESFLTSNRGSSSSITLSSLFDIDLKHILSTLGRMYSTNLFGNALNYSGELNFYEAPMLFTSILTILSIVALLLIKNYRKTTLVVLLLSLVAISLPIVNFIFNFTIDSYRWTFIVTYISIFAVGNLLDYTYSFLEKKVLVRVGLITFLLTSIAFLLIRNYVGKININSLICTYIFLLIFCFLLTVNKNSSKVYLRVALIFFVALELIINNYSLINNRGLVSKDEWNNSYYNDGTREAVDYIKEIDNQIFRIQRDNISVSLNDSLVHGYMGLNSYNSLNKFSYDDYIQNMNLETGVVIKKDGGGNHFEIDEMDYLINSLLGVKYIISDNDEYLPENYLKINEIDGKKIYKNKLDIQFAYTYSNEYSKESFMNSNAINKYDYLLNGFFYTDKESENEFTKYENDENKFIGRTIINKDNIDELDLINISATIDKDKIKIAPETNDPIMIYEFEQETNESMLLTIDITAKNNTEVEIYYSSNGEFSQDNSQYKLFKKKNGQVSFVLPKGVKYLRIDPSKDKSELYIRDISLYSLDQLNYKEKIKELNQYPLKNIDYKNSNLTGTISNESNNDIMLVIPFSFNSGIKAYVDEEVREVSNINGGLIGIKIESGNHNIRIDFTPKMWNVGKYISIFSISIYIISLIICKLKNKKAGRKND